MQNYLGGIGMALRNIRTEGDEILRKISKPVEEISETVKTLINDMKETMASSNGVGIAAPQVGVLKRVIIVDVGDGPIEFVNPEIFFEEGECIGAEGCLSVPEVYGEVKRPMKIKVRGKNISGQPFELDAQDMFARVICHEVDHLNGILFRDKVIKYIDVERRKKK